MTASRLAISGGTPVRETPLPKASTIGQAEKQAALAVLDREELSGFMASPGPEFFGGQEVKALEQDFCERFGCRHAVAVNSATSGLHAALMAFGLGPGDDVIVPPYTMHATATMVALCGAVPVFADIEDETFCLDPDAVEAAITPYTKGVIAVNLFGHPAALDPLRKICDRHGLFLLEDNAQSPDAIYHGRKTGTVGHAGVFSLNRHKTIQCGEGGVVVTNDAAIAQRAALFRNHGEAVVGPWGEHNLVNAIGGNFRMGEIEAAIARVQLQRLPALNQHRQQLAARLTAALDKAPGITCPVIKPDCSHVFYFFVMRFDENAVGISRDLFARALQAEGVPVRAGYLKPLYLEPMYQNRIAIGASGFPWSAHPQGMQVNYAPGCCPVVERLQDREVLLTGALHSGLSAADMDDFAAAFHKVLDNIDTLASLERQGDTA